jgi:ribonuclease HI
MAGESVPGWRRMRFKKNKVWVQADNQGQPVIENGKVRIKYQLDQPHEYRVKPENLKDLSDADNKTFQPSEKSPRSSPGKASSGKTAPGSDQNRHRPDNSDAIIIYTDGASSGNPGPSGIGAVLRYKGEKKEISEYIGHATNNIAELEAVRKALLSLKRRDLPVRLHTDSSYVQGLLVKNWKAKKNSELVETLRDLLGQFSDIKIIKVKGHRGVADNELADYLATSAISSKNN